MQMAKTAEKRKRQWWFGGKEDFKFLVKTYKPEYYWFELVFFLKKFLMAGVLVYTDSGSLTQLYFGLLFSFSFLCVVLYCKPYKASRTFYVACAAEVNLFVTISCILCVISL